MSKFDLSNFDMFSDFAEINVAPPKTSIQIINTTPNINYDVVGTAINQLINNKSNINAFVRGRLLQDKTQDPESAVSIKKHNATFGDGTINAALTQTGNINNLALQIFASGADKNKEQSAQGEQRTVSGGFTPKVTAEEPKEPDVPPAPKIEIPEVPPVPKVKVPDPTDPSYEPVNLPPEDETETAVLFITTAGLLGVKTFQLDKFLAGDIRSVVIDNAPSPRFDITSYYEGNTPEASDYATYATHKNLMDSQIRVMQTPIGNGIQSMLYSPFKFNLVNGSYTLSRRETYHLTYFYLVHCLSLNTSYPVISNWQNSVGAQGETSYHRVQHCPHMNIVHETPSDVRVYTPGGSVFIQLGTTQTTARNLEFVPSQITELNDIGLDYHPVGIQENGYVIDAAYVNVPGFNYWGSAPFWTLVGSAWGTITNFGGTMWSDWPPALSTFISAREALDWLDSSFAGNAHAWVISYLDVNTGAVDLTYGKTPDNEIVNTVINQAGDTYQNIFLPNFTTNSAMPVSVFWRSGKTYGYGTTTFSVTTSFESTKTQISAPFEGYTRPAVASIATSASSEIIPERSSNFTYMYGYNNFGTGYEQPCYAWTLSFPPNWNGQLAYQYFTYTATVTAQSIGPPEAGVLIPVQKLSDAMSKGSFGHAELDLGVLTLPSPNYIDYLGQSAPMDRYFPAQLIDGWFHVANRDHVFQGYLLKTGNVVRDESKFPVSDPNTHRYLPFIDYQVTERYIFIDNNPNNMLPTIAAHLGIAADDFVAMIVDVPDYVMVGLGFKKLFVADTAESIEFQAQNPQYQL